MVRIATAVFVILISIPIFATTFIVPNDTELINKSRAIVIGTIEHKSAARTADGLVETTYELQVERVLKGDVTTTLPLAFVSLGGVVDGLAQNIDGTAHFANDEHVLLFLVYEDGRWQPTDWTIGKFRFDAQTLVRDPGIVGWTRDGQPYVDEIRDSAAFIEFIEQMVAGNGGGHATYTRPREAAQMKVVANTVYPSYTYATAFTNGIDYFPARWTSSAMSSGVPFRKNSSQNATGLGDGGVSVIQNSLAAWNNDTQSVVNFSYAGTTTASVNGGDGINVVVFNDPTNVIGGSWTGSGIVAVCLGNANAFHSYDGYSNWASISDSDVVFQNGITGTESFFITAMTHELGHAIGLRHSNLHWEDNLTCDPNVEECTSNAIMNSNVDTPFNYTLQGWDSNGVHALYPSASACTDAYEPNESSATAFGPINTGNLSAKICTTVDADWYKADFTAGATVTLILSVPASKDYDLEIYLPNGSPASGSYNGSGQSEQIVYVVPSSGRYFIRVFGYANAYDVTNSYTLGYSTTGQFNLTVSRNGTGSGTVTSSPAGINCGSTCSANYATNTIVTLTATPAGGSTFAGWSGNCSGTGTCQVTMSAARSVTATFNTTGGVLREVRCDIENDRKSDIAIFRPVVGNWYFRRSSDSTTTLITNWGLGNYDIPVPGDYDGDDKVDAAVFRPGVGNWYIRQSSNGATLLISNYGIGTNDKPVPADYDGDGKTDAAIFRPGTGEWFLRLSSTGTTTYISNFGPLTNDVPVPGDYDGDNKADIAIFRPGLGNWYIRQSTNGVVTLISNFGPLTNDKPVQADYDGDGKTDIAIFRPLLGNWYIRRSSDSNVTLVSNYGPQASDIPVPADYDGDGKSDVAIFRPLLGDWYVLRSTTGTTLYISNYGPQSGDKPVPAYQY